MLKSTVDHLIANVIPAARDYNDAEEALTATFAAANGDQSKCQVECETAKRRLPRLPLLTVLPIVPHEPSAPLCAQVAPLCAIDGTLRNGCVDRVLRSRQRLQARCFERPETPDPL